MQISLVYVSQKYSFMLFLNPQNKIDFRGIGWIHADSWISTEPSRECGREWFVVFIIIEYLKLHFGTLKCHKFLSPWRRISHIMSADFNILPSKMNKFLYFSEPTNQNRIRQNRVDRRRLTILQNFVTVPDMCLRSK